MGDPKTIIELNGRAYDALSGKLLSDVKPTTQSAHSSAFTNPMHKSGGHSMDGFSRRSNPANSPQPLQTLAKTIHAAPPVTTTKPVQHHLPQKSKTLMRKAVSKPSLQPKATAHAHASQLSPATTNPQESHPYIAPPGAAARLHRASSYVKSSAISKFKPPAPSLVKKTAPLSVQHAPAHVDADYSKHHETVANLLTHNSHPAPLHHQAVQHHPKVRRFGKTIKGLGLVTAAFSILLLGGFFAYQYMPNIAMRVAASKAGFSARLPGYQPSGFSLQRPLKHSPGRVTASYKDPKGDRQFQLIQRSSTWNSETLLDNVVTASNQPYQTYQNKGNTIYIYGDSNATWVSGGVWYQIEGGVALSSDQLLRIANSF